MLAPFLLLSGKTIDDLGFPDKCMNMSQSTYTTVQYVQPEANFNFTAYFGLCFNSSCTAADLNEQRGTTSAT